MIAISTRGFETSTPVWKETDAPGFFNTLSNFNKELSALGSGHATVRMAVLDMPVKNGFDETVGNNAKNPPGTPLHELVFKHGSPSMTARILADPASLMDSKYYVRS